MPAKTAATATATDRRADLRKAYMTAFDGFATDVAEVREVLETTNDDARRVLQRLEASGLISSLHVNDEKALTYQANETYDSISRSTALRRFDKAFLKGQPVEINEPSPNGRNGATGPRYTDAQIEAGALARGQGNSWKKVAEIAGVKSPHHFSKAVRKAVPEAR